MIFRRRVDLNVLWILAAGFALTILLLLSAGYLGVQAMRNAEARSIALHAEHRISTWLIDEIQGEEAGLSSIFYELAAGPKGVSHKQLLERLNSIEDNVHRTLTAARSTSDAERWKGVKVAVERFITEVRDLLQRSGKHLDPPARLQRAHETLVVELAALAAENYQRVLKEQAAEAQVHEDHLRDTLVLLGIAMLLSVICAAATVHTTLQVFRRMEWQARELSRLSGHVLDTQEQMLHRFSRELHDEFGQTLTAIEANLAAVPAATPEVAARLEDCVLLVKDAMANVRDLSQLLRPSTLDDFGLPTSLQWLAESFSQRSGIEVKQQLSFDGRLPGEVETHLYRIAQEALTNVSRHSSATQVQLSLAEQNGKLQLIIADNGKGLQTGDGTGLGLIGMRERMRVTSGELKVHSTPAGVAVIAEIALNGNQEASAPDPSPVSG